VFSWFSWCVGLVVGWFSMLLVLLVVFISILPGDATLVAALTSLPIMISVSLLFV